VQVKSVIEDFTKAGHGFSGVVLNGFQPRTANKKLAYGYKAAAKGYQYGEKTPVVPKKKVRVAKEMKTDPVRAA
jgi:hypothetical protein